jgi:PAS domain S-box-containing protein
MRSTPTSKAVKHDPAESIRRLEIENRQLRRQLDALSGDVCDRSPEGLSVLWCDWDLRSILDHMPAMVGYWDNDLRNRFCNRAYLTWFGIDPAVIPGMHIRDVIGEELYHLNLPYIEGVLRGKEQQFQRLIPSPDGSRVRHSLAHYIPDIVAGEVLGFYALVTETTALHDAHEALRVSDERYRAVLDEQTELISRIAADGSFTFVNNVYCRFFGKAAEDLLGQAWGPVCHPNDVPDVEAQLRALSPVQPTVVIENRVCSASGEVRWMQFINRGFFDASGKLLEIQSVGRDITDRKTAESALREAHAQLEQRVVERTEQMRRLGVEKTLAEERERQAIARDLHDGLGQLLHVAKVKLDVLAKQLPASAIDVIGELDSLLADASHVTRSLTTQLSPPVLNKLGLPHALRWLAEEMNRLYGLSVFVGCEAGCPVLTPAHANILFRSVRELLINVAKHSGCSQAHLDMTCNNEQLVLTVSDAGVGIPDIPEVLSKTQGFGLASIRERLTFLGGETEIVSAPGAGLHVCLRMPLRMSSIKASEPG